MKFLHPCSIKFYFVDVNTVPATLVSRAQVTVGFLASLALFVSSSFIHLMARMGLLQFRPKLFRDGLFLLYIFLGTHNKLEAWIYGQSKVSHTICAAMY
jgi:hypothetical protein